MIKNEPTNELEDLFLHGIHLFEQQRYEEAFEQLTFLFQNQYRQQTIIFDILTQAYYEPNEEEMKIRYQENIALLVEYPFLFQKDFPSFEQLSYRFYPTGAYEGKYQIFDIEKNSFEKIWDVKYHSTPHYFADLSQPLCIENEFGQYQLQYLMDNVRRSEDYGEDNHIYLYYDNFALFCNYLQVLNLKNLLEEKKFVFLFGIDERNCYYPLDFKKHFNLDYAQLEAQPIKLEELKRIFYGWKIMGAVGTGFLADVLDGHPNLLTIPDCLFDHYDIFFEKVLKNRTVRQAIRYLRNLPDSNSDKKILLKIFQGLQEGIPKMNFEEFLRELSRTLLDYEYPSPATWLKAIYLTYGKFYGQACNSRIAPAIFFYPHKFTFIGTPEYEFHLGVLKEFSYYQVIGSIRDPIVNAGSILSLYTNGADLGANIFMAVANLIIRPNGFYIPQEHEMLQKTVIVRFEDLKLNPRATLSSLIKFFDIPWSDNLLKTTWLGYLRDGISTDFSHFKGFDPTPVYKTYSHLLSNFDKYRIELLKEKYYSAWGYKAKLYDGQVFANEDILAMFRMPFLCEKYEDKWSEEYMRNFRNYLAQIVQYNIVYPIPEGRAPLPWLKPQEDLLEMVLYE